ncbi:hypothetical protein L873DRAFT_1912205 [Choiromyces venosus 120613-1]|uniref:Reverse transcriptase RNase H-like domain-containing protein n=1 Tax=Choiromyces venosus 120613-1 TaxID=1336337 RepID=A0A3N4IQX8_9PEZI|nr:hypothetical protein L873DRAFT_1912205 [Choiromyces venosus 120613-1]
MDSTTLKSWMNLAITNDRLARWNKTLLDHNLQIVHFKGITNIVADALSWTTEENNHEWMGKVIPENMTMKLAVMRVEIASNIIYGVMALHPNPAQLRWCNPSHFMRGPSTSPNQ